MRVLFFIFVFIFSAKGFAANHCICEVGSWPKKHVGFYKLGCGVWFNQQKCDSKSLVKSFPGTEILDGSQIRPFDKVSLGYVGHWDSSFSTVRFIQESVLPLVQELEVDVVYENTACNPMKDPYYVHEELQKVNLPEGRSITVKGSQGLSIGMWDPFFMGKANFYAWASTEWSTPKFIPCSRIENKRCHWRYQAGESGLCYDLGSEELVELSCRQGEDTRIRYWKR